MRFVRFLLILPCVLATAWAALRPSSVAADTVVLKNGSKIEGKVTDNRQTLGTVLVEIGTVGRTIIKAAQIEKIESGAPPAANVERKDERVAVTLVKGVDSFYGAKEIEGRVSGESTDAQLVLDVPGGKMKLPRSGISKITKLEDRAAPPTAGAADPTLPARSFKTTHLVELTNGRKLQGNLVKTADWEPIKLQVGPLGTISIPRNRVAENGIKESEGVISLPEEQKAAPPTEAPRVPSPDAERARLKNELREEVLRELIEQLLEGRVDQAMSSGLGVGLDEQRILSNDQILAIQHLVRELSRQRSQNRVRAERQLKAAGAVVLPYLEPVANHPFALTRRAVQRILGVIGDWRGAPLAIERLNDSDGFVRELAHAALQRILPSNIAYGAHTAPQARAQSQALYRSFWEETVRSEAHMRLRERLLVSLR